MSAAETPVPASSVLFAISKQIASACADKNRAFLACKKRDKHPEACLTEGDAVTSCVVDLLKDLNQKAPEELKGYYECLDYYSNNFTKCRKEQKAFEEALEAARAGASS